MPNQLSPLESYCQQQLTGGVAPTLAPAPAKRPARTIRPVPQLRADAAEPGIQVQEEPLITVTAQLMYQLRCECGRSWFELRCPTIVHCPACHQAGLVSK